MGKFLLFLIAIIALAWFGAARIPLGFVMSRLPLNAMGVEWTQSEGTIWDGRIMGLYANGQPVGDVHVALKPLSLLSLKPAMDLQWGGAGGRGMGTLVLERHAIEASEVRLEHNVSALEGLAPEVRSIGGVIRLSQGAVRIEQAVDGTARCLRASGTVQSDTLALAAQQFGRTFSELVGTLSCADGAFSLVMNGSSPAGDTLALDADAALYGDAAIEVVVATADRDIQTLLANAGFSRADGVWTYQRTTQAGGAGAQ